VDPDNSWPWGYWGCKSIYQLRGSFSCNMGMDPLAFVVTEAVDQTHFDQMHSVDHRIGFALDRREFVVDRIVARIQVLVA